MSTTVFKATTKTPAQEFAKDLGTVQGVEIGATYRERDSRLRDALDYTPHTAIVEKVENNFVTLRRPKRTTRVQLQNFLERYVKVSNANS